ncbi:MFS general substrate transporter [Leucogyrophana mollusca]|uniref:MFS general substrate transporter n=1 Tax=Leucogyrophana mollusca TaxID=85980 RepID=A0ACB8BSC4_9AGAM|nr:MFS general substrate transporter [Leucogyrophana mollusca]
MATQTIQEDEIISTGGPENQEDSEPLVYLDQQAEERKLLRKLDKRILPITCLLYLFAYLDRSNLGNARLQGLPQDTLGGDPTGELFGWVNSAFFITYILFQVPGTVLSKYFNPRIWIGCSAIAWGLCSSLMATAHNFPGLVVARLALGAFEAAFGPAVVLYFSFYYTKAEYGTRIAYWFGFAAVAGAFGGLIAFGIDHIKASIANWRLLFIIEGVPTVLAGMMCILILPDRPESTTFLTPAERKLAMERMNRGTSGDVGRVINRKHVVAAFLDWRIYVAGVIYFGLNSALASISAFLPTIIATMGYTNALAQLMTVPPYAVAGTVLVLTSYTSDRLQTRGILVGGTCVLGAVGYLVLLSVVHNQHARYVATLFITSGTYASIGLVIAWFTHNMGSETKRATGIPLFGAIGQCGSMLGSHLYPLTEGPAYKCAFRNLTVTLLMLPPVCDSTIQASFRWHNRQRDRQYGTVDPDERVDTTELADKAPGFRYIP